MRLTVLLAILPLTACDGFRPVSASGFGAFEADLEVTPAGIAVAWYDNRHGNDEIYLRLLDGELEPLGPELRLTDNAPASYEADVASLGGDLAVAWYDRQPDGNLQVRVGLWSAQGERRWSKTLTTPAINGRVPVLESFGDRLFMAWVEEVQAAPGGTVVADSTIHGAWLDHAGAFLQAPFRIATASRSTWNLNTGALPDGRVALVFDAVFETRASELYLALIDDAAVTVTALSEDDGFASKYPDFAATAGSAALSWHDTKDGNEEIYLALLDPDHPPPAGGLETQARRVTRTGGASIGAYLAWNGPVLGLAWNDNDAGQHELWFQSFTREGVPLRGPRRLTDTPEASLIPSIAAFGESFVIAWGEATLGRGGHEGSATTTRAEIVVTRVD